MYCASKIISCLIVQAPVRGGGSGPVVGRDARRGRPARAEHCRVSGGERKVEVGYSVIIFGLFREGVCLGKPREQCDLAGAVAVPVAVPAPVLLLLQRWRTHNSISHHHSFSLIIMVGRGRPVRGPKALSPKCLNRGAFFLQGRAKRLFPGCENFCLVLLWVILGKTLEKAFFAPPCMDL